MKNIEQPHSFSNDVWQFNILNSNVKLAAVETTYWCRITKLPERVLLKKHHIVQVILCFHLKSWAMSPTAPFNIQNTYFFTSLDPIFNRKIKNLCITWKFFIV